jgi:predicted O-linked N-acetylglucosamine transferase (SPINDLY family)
MPPNPSEQISALIALYNQGRLEAVLEQAEVLSKQHPQLVFLHAIMGAANAKLRRLEPAIDCYTKALQIKPAFAEAHNNLGNILQDLGRHDEAIACYTKALQIKPDYAEAHNNLGSALQELGRHDEAIERYTKALQIKPDYADAHYNLGNALKELGRHDEAITYYTKALQIKPEYAEAHNNLGSVLQELGRHDEAVACYTKALQIKPDYAEAHNNLGSALQELGRHDEAIACYTKALQIKPAFAKAHYNLGIALQELGRHDEAIERYTKALQIKPDYAEAHAAKLHQQSFICDWEALAADVDAIETLGVSGNPVSPFAMLSLEDNPAHHRKRSERCAKAKYTRLELPAIPPPSIKPKRLRIGYFSADFHNHATMHLMARLFEVHNRTQFGLYAYSFGPNYNDAMRSRLKDAVDVFHDVRSLSDKDIAEVARKEGIDIAIDLKGYTANTRSGIFAYRAAPIQINYLGYPGTMGARFIDYIIADKTVILQGQREYYSEKIIYLPHSYQVNDNTREISDRAFTRAEMGLPEKGFVFCCFNNNYKISPREFNVWMRLLRHVDGSVLWLFKANKWAEQNLRNELRARGVDPDRLVFADRMPSPEHLSRHRLADLFLDTFNFNAHTTASDALRTGVPVVTKLGHGFSARVAGSLLNAIGLPELVTTSAEQYERLALDLATNTEELTEIRRKLLAHRNTAPLFNTELFTKHIERAYQQAYQRYFDGKEPDHIEVAES